ncbi:MAG: hypothetical protein ORN51_15780 [Akkermansiaceae bacterium]|nr:hypothetical protein [Akkermansiaceae bacterium]
MSDYGCWSIIRQARSTGIELESVRGFRFMRINAVAVLRRAGYHTEVIFANLAVWFDAVARRGDDAMAVDEWLLEVAELPVLRVYGWLGDWVSVGYFGEIALAEVKFPGVNSVRRWTGGGMVDHRCDWTYTLAVPQSEEIAQRRGGESYRQIHQALAGCLDSEGVLTQLSAGAEQTGDALCFENPVGHDLIDPDRRKLAGAGQRRSRSGLLHQGSVGLSCGDERISRQRAESFASRLAAHWSATEFHPDPQDIEHRAGARYANQTWTRRR